MRRIQDTIHGLMEFSGMETAVVDVLRAKELQRLRRVRQLGLAHLVFPAAEHSRLVHSIGAAHIALRFAKQIADATRGFLVPFLQPDATAWRDLALAALCHDLGHGPLSHAWEREVVGADFDREVWAATLGVPELATRKLKWHELVGQALLGWEDGELHRLLEQQEAGTSARVRAMLLGQYFLPYLPRLLSSDVDVDRCDFILRDAYQTGVAYGRYDLNWLISTVTVGTRENGNSLVLGFDSKKSPRVVEQFLVARRALYETVYHHKTVHCAEGMIGLFFRRAKTLALEGNWPWVAGAGPLLRKAMTQQALHPAEVLALDDHVLWAFVGQAAETPAWDAAASRLAQMLLTRDLLKMVPVRSEDLEEFLARDGAPRKKIEDVVKKWVLGPAECYVICDRTPFSMVSERPEEQAHFVDMTRSDRPSTPVREQGQMRALWQDKEYVARLFVPREAVDAVKELVAPR